MDEFRFATRAVVAKNSGLTDLESRLAALESVRRGAALPEEVEGEDSSTPKAPVRSQDENVDAAAAVAFCSGAAAIDALLRLLRPGDRVVAHDEVSAQTLAILENLEEFGIAIEYRDLADPSQWRFRQTSLVWLETPSTATLKVVNILSVARRAHEAGALVVADVTLASVFVTRALELGADVVLHAGGGAISGADLPFGAVISRNPQVVAQLRAQRDLQGNAPGELECRLASEGLRSLAVRLERQSQTALELAKRLRGFPGVRDVYYPGLEYHRGHAIAARQMLAPDGAAAFGPVLAVRLEREVPLDAFAGQAVASASTGVTVFPARLVRFSVGLEHIDDLWAMFERALQVVEIKVVEPEPVVPAIEPAPPEATVALEPVAPAAFQPANGDPTTALSASQLEVYVRLRQWRDHEAARLGINRLMIASNALLAVVAQASPSSLEALAALGLDASKLEHYAQGMLAAIAGVVPAEPSAPAQARSSVVVPVVSRRKRRGRGRHEEHGRSREEHQRRPAAAQVAPSVASNQPNPDAPAVLAQPEIAVAASPVAPAPQPEAAPQAKRARAAAKPGRGSGLPAKVAAPTALPGVTAPTALPGVTAPTVAPAPEVAAPTKPAPRRKSAAGKASAAPASVIAETPASPAKTKALKQPAAKKTGAAQEVPVPTVQPSKPLRRRKVAM